MRYFMIVMGIIIALTFILAILAGSTQVATPAPARDARPVDAPPLIYLALVGGAALLAGMAWLGTLRTEGTDMEQLTKPENPCA